VIILVFVGTNTKRNLKITAYIEAWFTAEARNLPWRNLSTPWGRLVSEFMSQQTQIERVAQRWPKMMAEFPTPKSMAICDEQDVLALWQGLGYYRRAKHLKQTAEMIESHFGGQVPSDVISLLKLPGVGKYTAGAIASIAFNQNEPIVDGNVHRVICRLENKCDAPAPNSWSWELASLLVMASKTPSVFNEGLMELGATICTPRNPKCDRCPLQKECAAFSKNTQSVVPPPRISAKRKRLHHYAVVLTCNGKIAFEKRGDKGLWAGMWQVPTFESTKKVSKAQISEALQIENEISIAGSFEHTLTHRIINFTVYRCEAKKDERFIWRTIDSLEALPLASAQRKVLSVHCAT
jgi:A/G-specific adenine glycosylase